MRLNITSKVKALLQQQNNMTKLTPRLPDNFIFMLQYSSYTTS